ncbi:MAG TPA: SprT-like domain-containing protein [Actinomycetales bacterium]|nr:SprT-like domain-containing protein [Actinomycetales bacterium]
MDLNDARRLASKLMTEHGLSDWGLVFDSAKRRAGVCRASRREIGLSRHLTSLHSEAEVRETILHEIAHALVGPGHGHDAVWRATAVRIGCSGDRCLSEDAPRIPGSWVGECPAGHRRTAHRRPVRVRSCSQCSPVFDLDAVFVWTHNGRAAPMHPDYEAELAGLRALAVARAKGGRELERVLRFLSETAKTEPAVGDRVRLRVAGKYGGLIGTIEGRGRTRFKVQTERGLLSAPFALVDRFESDGRC